VWGLSPSEKSVQGNDAGNNELKMPDYIQTLHKARERLVTDRRAFAEQLAKSYERGATEQARAAFVAIQDAIAAIDEAITDEEEAAAIEASREALKGV
jgi:hypothetical protein